METNLVTEGLKFMVLGMSTVFLFLLLMIFTLKVQSKLLQKYFPDAPAEENNAAAPSGKSKNKVAAIIGAIMQHKQSK